MITAEHSDQCTTPPARLAVGPLTANMICAYGEYQIINYTEQPIYVIDHRNEHVVLEPQYFSTTMKRVDIVWRQVVGSRSFDPCNRAETTKNYHHELTIPLDKALRYSPVYVEQLNVVLCTEEHFRDVCHPNTPEYQKIRWKAIYDEVAKGSSHAPFMILANDPTGEVKELYLQIHGRTVAAKVTNFKDEPDTLTIAYRDLGLASAEYDIHQTTFAELRKKPGLVWDFAGITLSSSRKLLEHEFELRAQQQENEMIRQTDLQVHLDRTRQMAEQEVRRLTDENAALKKRVQMLEQIRAAAFSDKAADIELKRLALEQEKLAHGRVELQHAITAEKVKLKKERTIALSTLLKAVAAAIPILLGMVKFFLTPKPA